MERRYIVQIIANAFLESIPDWRMMAVYTAYGSTDNMTDLLRVPSPGMATRLVNHAAMQFGIVAKLWEDSVDLRSIPRARASDSTVQVAYQAEEKERISAP
jgi:hypothetical protein